MRWMTICHIFISCISTYSLESLGNSNGKLKLPKTKHRNTNVGIRIADNVVFKA